MLTIFRYRRKGRGELKIRKIWEGGERGLLSEGIFSQERWDKLIKRTEGKQDQKKGWGREVPLDFLDYQFLSKEEMRRRTVVGRLGKGGEIFLQLLRKAKEIKRMKRRGRRRGRKKGREEEGGEDEFLIRSFDSL